MENTMIFCDENVAGIYEPIDISGNVLLTGSILVTENESFHYKKSTFLNIFNMDKQVVTMNSPVLFDLNNSIQGHCYHEERTSQICIWKVGFYHVFINIYYHNGCQFSLYKNAIDLIPGSTTQNSNAVILSITSDDIIMDCSYSPTGKACSIELVNITPNVEPALLYDASGLGYIYPQINCSITLFSL